MIERRSLEIPYPHAGINQMPGNAPWNYGNYYLGNTTMQTMPLTMNKVREIQLLPGVGVAGLLGSTPMAPCCMPCSFNMPCSFSMPMGAPMMAAASPLPVAFNPLVQGMYPTASMAPVNWMAPASFMSALTTGPMPYRPPASDFPSNVGMVMALPYGTPNPLLSPPNYGSFSSAAPVGGSPSCFCFSLPTPPVPPPISYHSSFTSVPPPYQTPAPMPSTQQLPANYDQPLPYGVDTQLRPSEAVVGQGPTDRATAIPSTQAETSTRFGASLPIYKTTYGSPSSYQSIYSPPSHLASTDTWASTGTPSKAKYSTRLSESRDQVTGYMRRFLPSLSQSTSSKYSRTRRDPVLPPILEGQLISDSGWLPKSAPLFARGNKPKQEVHVSDHGRTRLHSNGSRVSFLPNRRRRPRRSSSSVSEYDCVICQQQQAESRLHDYYSSSTVSSILSPSKHSRRKHARSHESKKSSRAPAKHRESKSARRQEEKDNNKIASLSTRTPSNVPILLKQSSIPEDEGHQEKDAKANESDHDQSTIDDARAE